MHMKVSEPHPFEGRQLPKKYCAVFSFNARLLQALLLDS